MRTAKVSALVLKRSNFGEADKILTIFTRERGKIKVLAKGIRRIKSRRSPHLELFNYIQLILHQGKTFAVVTEAKLVEDFADIKKDLQLTGYLFYLAEVLDKLLPEHQPHPEVFAKFLECLGGLGGSGEKIVKNFVTELLWDLGYLPRQQYPKMGVTAFVETIAERKIKSKKFLEMI